MKTHKVWEVFPAAAMILGFVLILLSGVAQRLFGFSLDVATFMSISGIAVFVAGVIAADFK